MLFYLSLIILFLTVFVGLMIRGTLLHELLHLPIFHFRLFKNRPGSIDYYRHSYGTDTKQYFLHFPPSENEIEKKQVVIFFHGGGWSLGSPEMFKINAAFFTKRGYHVFMPSYRRVPFYGYPEIREDIDICFFDILKEMKELELEGHNIILGGTSAGGNLAALLAYDRARLEAQNVDPKIFSGIILFGAALDLSLMYPSPVRWFYAGSSANPDFKKASPINYLQPEETLPVLMVHGTKDGLVAYRSAEAFIKKISERQSENLTIEILPEGSHLDVGSWNFFDNDLRKLIVNWLAEREAR